MPPTEPIFLTPGEARVLGALIEKEVTTPDYYPLTLNALINACNQRSNREPVMDLDEESVRQALHGLEDRKLAGRARAADGRAPKYEHWLGEVFNFSRAEVALLCVLLLRGPQTPGELRSRTERMHHFEEIADVLVGLQKLMEREPALAAVLPRQPGTKESRYAHLFSDPANTAFPAEPAYAAEPVRAPNPYAPPPPEFTQLAPSDAGHDERITRLESLVAELRQDIINLHKKFDDLFGD